MLGIHGDVLIGRDGAGAWGAGPCAEVWTDWQGWGGGLGASALVPILEDWPLVGSATVQWRELDGTGEPQTTGEIFWGTRSYNYHGAYEMSGGVVVGGRVGFGEMGERAISISLHIDGEVLMLPVVMLIGGFGGH